MLNLASLAQWLERRLSIRVTGVRFSNGAQEKTHELNAVIRLDDLISATSHVLEQKEVNMNYRVKFLKVKVKSLAEESRIIRKEEGRARSNELREQLYLHRVKDVRDECRATHLAYGYLRGKPYASIERPQEAFWQSYRGGPIWAKVQRMVAKYGDPPLYLNAATIKDPAFDEIKLKLETWRKQ